MDVVRLHQSGIAYAVATLGTATTPEHLKRAFRVVQRDRVLLRWRSRRSRGRVACAAERTAGGHRRPRAALPVPARRRGPGLTGRQGRPRALRSALRRRTAAVGISRRAPHRIDRHPPCRRQGALRRRGAAAARARARRYLSRAAARPARRGDRCQRRTLPGDRRADGAARRIRAADGKHPRSARRPARAAPRDSAGRGGLVRQAVQNLLHFPAIAARVGAERRRGAGTTVDEPGMDVLRELLDSLQEQPAREHRAGARALARASGRRAAGAARGGRIDHAGRIGRRRRTASTHCGASRRAQRLRARRADRKGAAPPDSTPPNATGCWQLLRESRNPAR